MLCTLGDENLLDLINPITEAINAYNNIPNCRLNFNLTTAANQDILIQNEVLFGQNGDRNVCGRASAPANGRVGSRISIDLGLIGTILDDVQIRRLIIHELGHAVGLRHTDWLENGEGRINGAGNGTTATHILGTTTIGDDDLSIMRSNSCNALFVDFTFQDIVALQFIYPENPPVAGTVPVFRYHNPSSGNHLFTTNINELGDGRNDHYIFEGVAFFAFTTAQADTTPVFRLYRSNSDQHLFTADANERNILRRSGFNDEGIAFHAFPANGFTGLRVHRFIKPNAKHFFSLNLFEGQDVGLRREGTAFNTF